MIPRWPIAAGILAAAAGGLAAWLSSRPFDPADYAIPEPPFLPGPVAVRSLDGEKIDLRAPASGVAVLLFHAPDCPDAEGSAEALARLSAEIPPGRGLVLGVRVAPRGDSPEAHAGPLPASATVEDLGGELARTFGVKAIPEAFVLDGAGVLRYRGRPDRAAEAARAVLAGGAVAEASTEAVGCPLPGAPGEDSQASPPTYHRDVETILRRSCRACHRPGQSGPFPLLTYAEASKRARDLADVTRERLMPPWKPVPGVGPPLKHDRTLLPSEVETLAAWADAGAPEGDPPADPPAPPAHDGEWALGSPDLVLEMPEPFEVPAEGEDVYRCFVLPTELPEGRFLTAIEVLPGNPRVVHHTFGYVDTRGLGRGRDREAPGPGYPCFSGFTGDRIFGLLGGWTPGNEAHPFGDGVGLELPRKADVVMQVHYHPSGRPERDRTRLGLHLSKAPARQALEWVSACPDIARFRLPAGDPEVGIGADLEVPIDVSLHAMTPHMHLLGRRFRAEVTFPDGRVEPLIAIDDWDFNRQDTYYLREPLSIPAGSTVHIEGWYDNSPANPRNPSRPPRDVAWGEGTTDDMLILFLALTQDGQDLTRPGARNTFMEDFFGTPASTDARPDAGH